MKSIFPQFSYSPETVYRIAFFVLLIALLAMRLYFMVKVRRSGGRITPDEQAVKREGGRGVFAVRIVAFFALIAFLVMYLAGAAWIEAFSFALPAWLRWAGFVLGIVSVVFWTWTQIHLDTQWSAQLQLKENHHLVTTGPYAHIRHPLYAGMIGWGIALTLLTANWIFFAICALSIAGLLWRIPKEEQMMIDAFGDEYRAYMQDTGRLFPKI
jgi:protein-S-isoprenylcysteine O-methyltransferase Ste14